MPNPTPIALDAVHDFAKHAHAGQVDKTGHDYYTFHLVPVAAKVAHLGEHAEMAALLHDYIEDILNGDVAEGIRILTGIGVPVVVIDAVVSVTRLPDETYADLIRRSCADPLGVHIKLADNHLNISNNPALAALDPDKAARLLTKRYLPARDRLVAARALHALGVYGDTNLDLALAVPPEP